MYLCPLCQQPLLANPQGLSCASRHQFDRAREGYLNLLPVQQKKSLDPGDSAAMIQARRAFLQAGFYQALSDAVNLQMAALPLPTNAVLLDIGCGEGYYSARLQQSLQPLRSQLQCFGIDISKAAVKAAAKQYPQLQVAVASSYQLPFASQSIDALLRIYAPSKAAELARVCRPGGYLLTVTPAPQHLLQLKQRIYSEVRLHPESVAAETGFSHQQRQRLSWTFQPADAAALSQLLQMIPLGYRFNADSRQQLLLDLPAISLDFYLDLYQRSIDE
jgi:23S rRNA (guanine745-N1)-methyltransferase